MTILSKALLLGRGAALVFGTVAMTATSIAQTPPPQDAPQQDGTPQTVEDQEVPGAAALDLPSNLQIFGNADPNIRKATAIVNDSVITGTDVDQRVAAVVALNNLRISDREMMQLRLQILRQLIDETLQIQEAQAHDITVTQAEIDQAYARIAQNFGRTPEELSAYLRQSGSSPASMRRQIQGELAWNRLLRARVAPFINVSEEEVNAIIARMEAARGTDEFHVKEIYISATPDRAREVFGAIQQMMAQMRNGAPFEYFASTYSEASTRSVGGDLGWVRSAMLPDALSRSLQGMQIGQVAGPIEVPGGFSLLYLVDKRQVLMSDQGDAVLNLRQMTLHFPAGTTQAQATSLAARFSDATREMQGCGDVTTTAQRLGAEVVDNDRIRIRDLPPQLREMMQNLQVGEATPPFGSLEDGVRVLVLCGRDDPPPANLPSADELSYRIEQERLNMRAQRMLRDLRRDAIIEYR